MFMSVQVKTLRVDKELLTCRNKCLASELHHRETRTACLQMTKISLNNTGGRGDATSSWLLDNSSDYEVMMM